MSANEERCLKHYFESKSLHVSNYWLQCCLEWFKDEYQTYTEEFMCSSVYQQWLDADLRDIEVRSLPNNLSQQKKTILNGKYAVQIMYVKDISKPAYSQLKNIRDTTRSYTDIENEPVETSGKRVLNLCMTDGVQEINGFEYHTVQCLNLYMTPGIKILLTGPLIVRNGEFMFRENNITILGGEVEAIKVSNAAENILARELNMTENPHPRSKENSNNTTNNSIQRSTYTPQVSCTTRINCTELNKNMNNINTNNVISVMSEFEDDQFLANFDTSVFEEQERTIQAQINQEDADLNQEDDLFENLDFTEVTNLTSSVDATNINKENLEELERQEFEKRLQDEEENFDYPFFDNGELIQKVIEERTKPTLPIITDAKPFIYIAFLRENSNKLLNNKSYRVKAWFRNNIQKIKLSKNKGWTMEFEIKDASGKINVDFLSEVIEELMELSPAEALAENRRVKNNESKSHEKLSEALVKCKKKLDSFEYIMDLQFHQGKDMATIVKLEPVNKQHLQQLNDRVKRVSIKLF